MRDSGDEVKLLVMGSVSGLDYGMQTWGIGFHANSCIFELLMQSHYSLPPRPFLPLVFVVSIGQLSMHVNQHQKIYCLDLPR